MENVMNYITAGLFAWLLFFFLSFSCRHLK
jgi:hypothetical protein